MSNTTVSTPRPRSASRSWLRWFRRDRGSRPAAPPESALRRWLRRVGFVVAALGLLFWWSSAKILREPVVVAYGPEDPLFRESLGPLLGADFTDGNKFQTLLNGVGIFPPMLDAIRAAKQTITLETYIWASGKISDAFIEALVERARAGVKVHVLADGVGLLNLKQADQNRLLDGGVEFLVYGREHWWQIKPNINHRTHRKLLVIDGRIGFTGGVCIADEWLGNADSPEVWRETQIRAEGPVVRQMQSVFAANWLQTTGRLLVGPGYFPPVSPPTGVYAQCYRSGPGEDPENARISYLLAIATARKAIRISHAYFVPDDLAVDMLVAARERGVNVEVIVPAHNDSAFGAAAARSRWGALLDAGVKIYRYEPAMFHCKVMIVDDIFVTIGSVNFDNRSFGINDEVNVNILDTGVARENIRIFEQDRAKSTELTLAEYRGRPWWGKLRDSFCGLFRSQL